MPWIDRVPAVLEAWFSGSEAGNALADVVFGAVNPSGKLPFTFPVRLEDNSAHALGEYPGTDKVAYNEGTFVGYRWHDKERIKRAVRLRPRSELHDVRHCECDGGPHGPCGERPHPGFGRRDQHGFASGRRGRAAVYLGHEQSSLPRPVKELKGFQKVSLNPGQTQTVTFEITPDMLRYYDRREGRVGCRAGCVHGLRGCRVGRYSRHGGVRIEMIPPPGREKSPRPFGAADFFIVRSGCDRGRASAGDGLSAGQGRRTPRRTPCRAVSSRSANAGFRRR